MGGAETGAPFLSASLFRSAGVPLLLKMLTYDICTLRFFVTMRLGRTKNTAPFVRTQRKFEVEFEFQFSFE